MSGKAAGVPAPAGGLGARRPATAPEPLVHEVLEEVALPPDRRSVVLLLGGIGLFTAAAWAVLVLVVVPQHLRIGTTVFGLGLGFTAYTLGVRHAFDADHIAAIDNTTRRLMGDGRPAATVGFWFALGHSSVVVLLAAGIAGGVRFVVGLTDGSSAARSDLGMISTGVSGLFLYLIGMLNLAAFVGVVRLYRHARAGLFDGTALERVLDRRGLVNRLLGPLLRSVRHPAQMWLVGLLFGVGFDTATEVTLLVLAGSGAAAGLPWYLVLVLPALFTAGMCLFDTLDGAFMTIAYRWAFAHPVRRLYYNLTITGLSVAVALLIGTIELVGLLHDRLHWTDGVTAWVAGLDLGSVGFLVAGLFVVVWALAVGWWKLGRVEARWSAGTTGPDA